MKDLLNFIRKKKYFNVIIACIVSISVIPSLGIYYVYLATNNVRPYQVKDQEFIENLFKDNWYWLVSGNTNHNPDYIKNILKYKSPSGNLNNQGLLNIYTYNQKDNPVAMVAFYKVKIYEGAILFLGVDKDYRGKGYAKKLLNFALDKFKSQNISLVKILTRINNKIALALYKKLGFKEIWTDESYVRLIKKL